MKSSSQEITVKQLTSDLWPALEELFGTNGAGGGGWCMDGRIRAGERYEHVKGPTLVRYDKAHGPLACASRSRRDTSIHLDRDAIGIRFATGSSSTHPYGQDCMETGPPKDAVNAPASRGETAAEPGAKPIVLVVDDFDDNRLLYATTIAEAGYPVEQATNGQEALDKIGSTRPAIIIMDLSMPVLDGWEATRRIKADPRTADIVIIALTGHATNFGLQQARDAGAEAVLTKPCLPQDLLGVISALLPPAR